MIAGGLALGITIRAVIGPKRIDRNKLSFDGIAACGMVLFVIPLFDGVGATVLENPPRALWVLALAFLFNLAINRTIAIYLAALPHDPQFALFVALFQFPMYLTPLIWPHIMGLKPFRVAPD